MDGVKSATVLACVHAGSRFEPGSLAGISHFLEHMVFKGTEKYPDVHALSSTIDAIGAQFNAFTSKDHTVYYVKAASTHLSTALDVVSDMLLTPKLREEDLEKEKGVIVEEIHMYEDTPYRHIGDLFEQVMFQGTTLGRDIIGTVETVRGLRQQHFRAYINDWYGSGNLTVAIAGDGDVLRRKETLNMVEQYFAKGNGKRKDGKHVFPKKSPYSKGRNILVQYKKTEQAHFMLGFPGLKRKDPDRYALAVLSGLFGGYMSSRLFTEVREKRGLCYYVRSDTDIYEDSGVFSAAAGVDVTRVDEAVKVVYQEFMHLTDTSGSRTITEEEVSRAKEHLIGGTILHVEDSQNVALYYAKRQALEKDVEPLEQTLEHIRKVTHTDVLRVAKRLLERGKPYFAVIGPYKDAKRFERLLS